MESKQHLFSHSHLQICVHLWLMIVGPKVEDKVIVQVVVNIYYF